MNSRWKTLTHGAFSLSLVTLLVGASCGKPNDGEVISEEAALSASAHPLDPLTAAEIQEAFGLLGARVAGSFPGTSVLYPILHLDEPAKPAVLAWARGERRPNRSAYAQVFVDRARLYEAIVDLTTKQVVSLTPRPGVHPATSATEYGDASGLVLANADWRDAMRRRDLNPDDVYLDLWAPGETEGLTEVVPNQPSCPGEGPRYLRVLSFRKNTENGGPLRNPYPRPVEGVVVTVDMTNLCVAQVLDCTGPKNVGSPQGGCFINNKSPLVSRTSGDAAKPRPTMRQLQISGGDIAVKGHEVSWGRWRFRFALHHREGLMLYNVGYLEPDGTLRPVAYRMSLSEIYVPYGLPDVNWLWLSAFDVGEYKFGEYANTLKRHQSVPDNTVLAHASLASDTGEVVSLPDVIGLYERDNGILWSRVDPSSAEVESRLSRELVLTQNSWLGNYLYGLNYIFKLDGTIEVRVDLMGTTLNQGVLSIAQGDEFGTTAQIDPATGAIVAMPNHQHFFNFRLDLDIDGPTNYVSETNTENAGVNRFPNAFRAVKTRLEREGFRDVSPATNRSWVVESSKRNNALRHPTGYSLHPRELAFPYSGPGFGGLERAQFARHQLWVTRYRQGELYAAGDFPNQGPPGQGLPQYTSGESIHDEDVVLWYTFGHTHHPTPEQYPVINTESAGFTLVPHGFFNENPALDVQVPRK